MPRTLVCTLILLLLPACDPAGGPSDDPTPPPLRLTFDPAFIDFGPVPIGSESLQTITVRNPGDATLVLPSPVLTGSDFFIEDAPAALRPGEEGTLVLGFAPTGGPADGRVSFPSLDNRPEVLLEGEGLLPRLQIPMVAEQLGGPAPGCARRSPFWLTNVSDVPVVISSVEVVGGDGQVTISTEFFPIVTSVEPGESAAIDLIYRPTIAGPTEGSVVITTDDPGFPTYSVPFEGDSDASIASSIDVEVPPASLDLLLVIDDSSCSTAEQDRLAAALPHYLDSEILGVDWRVAVTTTSPSQGGEYVGTTPWVHPLQEDWDIELANRIQQGTSGSGDERGLDAALQGLTPPISTGFLRPNTPMAVILVSDEDDGSVLLPTPADYADALRALRDDPDQVRFHDITGGATGCTEAIGSTGPGLGYIDVTAALGGVSGDICAADYDATVADQMAVSVNPPRFVPLPETAIPETVRVEVGGPDTWQTVPHGVFDGGARLGTLPPWETTIRVHFDDTALCGPI